MSDRTLSHTDGNFMPNVTYGFIGLGNMGSGMAKNLRAKMPRQALLIVCELDKKRTKEFLSSVEGLIEVADTPREVAERSSIIVTSLPHGAAVSHVFTDPSIGLLSVRTSSSSRKFFLETSTIEVRISNEVLKEVEKSGLGDFIDCPVSGGIPSAHQGSLTFMVGGSEALFQKAKPVLVSMGKEENLLFCGRAGAGLVTKQINNYCANVAFIGLCEGMNTGVKYGLDPKVLADAINVSSGMSWNSLNMNPIKGVQSNSSASKDFEGGFKTELAKGVIDMAVELMDGLGAKHVMGNVVKDIYARAVEHPKCADKECRSVFRLIAEDDGKDLGETKVV
ncbi:hypothetical protein LTR84_001830 [Exophiala bonariae]|uniref:3-hydroxyisobutyrate dehydrogenase n=1 Tax=Exophiala bonariae TaxID=1690606 RepID=A0AAV9NBM1_9EURO|nr:hypothetical protein LTR84_001830 [Exophiala bonariae]